MLAREDSKLSNSSTSFYSAVSYQHASEENVARQAYFIQSPITADVPDLSAPHSIPAASNLKHDKVGPGPTVLIPVARPRPKRHVLDLVAACAEGTEYDRLHAKKPAEVVVELDPLTAYLAQDREVEHWDIKAWVGDCIEYGERATEAAKQQAPAPRQCKQYYLTDNFNPWRLNVQWDARAERENWNRDLALVRPRWVALPQDPRERQLALIRDQALMAQIRMVEDAHLAEEAFLEEQARIGRQEHAGRVDPVPVEPQRAIDIPQTRVDPEPAEPQRAIDISQTNVSRYPCYEIQRSAPIGEASLCQPRSVFNLLEHTTDDNTINRYTMSPQLPKRRDRIRPWKRAPGHENRCW